MSQIIFTGGGGVTPGSAVETLTGDTGGAVSPTANNINVVGGENINTVGTPGTSTITVNLNETIHWSDTNGAGTTGAIFLGATGGVGGNRFMHNFGTATSTFLGNNAGNFTNTGTENTGIGDETLTSITTGEANTACGKDALNALDGGNNNSAFGDGALENLTGGSPTVSTVNTALGCLAGLNLVSGSYNTLVGGGNDGGIEAAGAFYTTNESSNICIGNGGVIGDNHTIRIGNAGSGDGQHNLCFIAGIFGVTTGGSGTAVFIDNTGKLGTIVSSKRFKNNIIPISDEESSQIHKLKPVSFSLISNPQPNKNIGLIAEEVDEHMPELVIKDNEGKPFTVKYHELQMYLLKEIQKQNQLILSLQKRINLIEQVSGEDYEL